jgi:hypothetical protein
MEFKIESTYKGTVIRIGFAVGVDRVLLLQS